MYIHESMVGYSIPFVYCYRNNIELIEKTEQLVRELKHLDSTQAQW